MPTPFYHLSLAQELLAEEGCPPALAAQPSAFLLGNIAPDAQNISGQTREATHFFDVPMTDQTPAWEVMFGRYPALGEPRAMPQAQVAFVAGYICHLALDQMWIASIFDPIFGQDAPWATFRERLFLHNVLRIHLDEHDRPALGDTTAARLRRAAPLRWLPFLADEALIGWRDFVAGQLAAGGTAQTVEVFARRMGLNASDFESLLGSPAAMRRRVFGRITPSALAEFRAQGLTRSRRVIAGYVPERTG